MSNQGRTWVFKSGICIFACTAVVFGFQNCASTFKSSSVNLNLASGGLPVLPPLPPIEECDQTISVGGNLATAIIGASSGATICLNPGNYGTVKLNNVKKSSDVTIRSAQGKAAVINLEITRSSRLVIRDLTISGMYIAFEAQNISVLTNTFTGQLLINMGASGGNYGDANILIDSNSFNNISVCNDCYDGRIQVMSEKPSGVTISNNHFGGAGESDGIQVSANGVVIGPGNIFDGIIQGSFTRHVDAIQLYRQSNTKIVGNYFTHNSVQIMAPDGGSNDIIAHNVFVGNNIDRWGIHLGSQAKTQFVHNTVRNIDIQLNKRTESPKYSTNLIVRNNVLINSGFNTVDSKQTESCIDCVFEQNLFDASTEQVRGSDNVIGTPVFKGGAVPVSWAGYQLDSQSPGGKVAQGGPLGPAIFGSRFK